jgi:hypothetical protein
MTLEQRSERIAIARDRGGDETGIWIAADLCHPLPPATLTQLDCGL